MGLQLWTKPHEASICTENHGLILGSCGLGICNLGKIHVWNLKYVGKMMQLLYYGTEGVHCRLCLWYNV